MSHATSRLPHVIVGGLLTAILSIAATGIARGQNVPVVPNVPQEDAYQYRGLPPQEAAQEAAPAEDDGPTRYLETEFLKKRNISTYGWIDAGIGANAWGADWNGPITFNDRAWQGMMNQLYLVNERTLDTEDGGWDWGGRIDLLYGTDYIYTTARGLDAYQAGDPLGLGAPRWGSSKYYGLAMPQLYAEVGYNDLAVKVGHFYTIIGYEVVPAVGNFFYTHAYTMQYGEPFTHTGILTTWTPNDQVVFYNGIVNGWDNWDGGTGTFGPVVNSDYPSAGSNASYLGGATMKSSDESQALTITAITGNENPIFGVPLVGNRSLISLVYVNELSDKLTYVLQNDNGWQFNAFGPATKAQWYGINQYLFYAFNETWTGGMRFEWFRDNDGYRVFNPIRNQLVNQPYAAGYRGNFWALTWGLNYKPNANWIIRPELRYDWYNGQAGAAVPGGAPALPYGNADKDSQFYGGCDIIWQF